MGLAIPPEVCSGDHDAPRSDVHHVSDVSSRPRVDVDPELPIRAARALIEALVHAGVDTFFGIPGGPAAPIFQALDEVEGARLVESRQESAAGFEAAGYFRATGRVPAVVVTAGPGATQAVTGIVNASLERVPMIVVAADVAWSVAGGRMLQDSGPDGIAIEDMFAKSTRTQVRVSRPESAATQAMAALDCALDPERPGPSLLVVPMQHAAANTRRATFARRSRVRHATIDPTAVAETCDLLAAARRPLIVLGGGTRRHAAAMRQLVDVLDIPFVTTPTGKGVVSEEHPRSLRHGGLAASAWARAYTSLGVDVCLVLGTDLDDIAIGPTRYVAEGGKLIHVDLDSRVFHRNLPTELAVVADVEVFADSVRAHWSACGMRQGRVMSEVRALKKTTSPYTATTETTADRPIAPHRAIADLCAALPDARYCSDIGEHMLFALHFVTAKDPSAFHIQLSLGSMGSGIATAVGLAFGDRGRDVVCIAGDGCMQMMGSEALVAVQHRLPIVFAVFNDARYNMVHHGMRQLYGRARQWSAGPMIDFAKWGESMGMTCRRISRAGELTPALLANLRADGGPVLLDIRIDRDVRLAGAGRVEALQQMSSHEMTTGGSR
ncbi:MAG: thiamine pyrophosphate-binding protein [Sandaracinus sp.]